MSARSERNKRKPRDRRQTVFYLELQRVELLRAAKIEMAALRANLADSFYALSEPLIPAPEARA